MLRPPTLGPQARFVLRGSALLMGMLALWWFALQPPMLFLLRSCESVALRLLASSGSAEPIVVDASGDWNFRVPVEDTAGAPGSAAKAASGPVKFRAIEFTIPRADVVLFTFSVPVYWAIVLAAPWSRSALRPLLWGTALVSAGEVLSLLALVEITAYAVVAQWHSSPDGLAAWSRDVGSKLIVGVIPFAAPVLAAVALHPELRSQILPASGSFFASRPAIIGADGSRAGTSQRVQVQRQTLDRDPHRDFRDRGR